MHELLEIYDYPGNARELENIIAEAVVVETGRTLTRRSLPRYLLNAVAKSKVSSAPAGERKTLAEMEAGHIRHMLELTAGNRTAASKYWGYPEFPSSRKSSATASISSPPRVEGAGKAPRTSSRRCISGKSNEPRRPQRPRRDSLRLKG